MLKTVIANRKLSRKRLSLALTKLTQDNLLLRLPETKSFKDSSNWNNNNIRLSFVRADKKSKTVATNKKLISDKLLSTLIKLVLRIKQDIKTKKVSILKTS